MTFDPQHNLIQLLKLVVIPDQRVLTRRAQKQLSTEFWADES